MICVEVKTLSITENEENTMVEEELFVHSRLEPDKRLSDFPISMMLGQMTIRCRDCLQRFSCDRFLPYFDATLVKHCVVCGSENIEFIPWRDDKLRDAIDANTKQHLWSDVADRLGVKYESALMLYEAWSPVNGDDKNFFRWAKVKIVEIRAAREKWLQEQNQ